MDNMLNRIIELLPKKADGSLVHGCKKDLTDYIGLPSNTFAEWNSGRNRSYRNYVVQIAEYFHVQPSFLLGVEEKEKAPAPKSEDCEEELLLSLFRKVPKEQRRSVLAAIEMTLRSQGLL